MKIEGHMLPNAPHSRGDRAGSNAQNWLAELEKAWLQGWQNQPATGERLAAQGSTDGRQRDAAEDLRASVANDKPSNAERSGRPVADRAREQGAASIGVSSLRAAAMPASGAVVSQALQGPAGATLAMLTRLPVPAVEGEGSPQHGDGVSGAVQRWTIASAVQATPQLPSTSTPGAPSLPDSSPAEGVTQEPPGAAADPAHTRSTPHAKTLLQVAVSESSAQVTLRDAQLLDEQAAATGRTLAAQLLSMGLQSVRVYVNGVETRHQSNDRLAGGDLTTPHAGVHPADVGVTSNPSPLERT